MRNVIIIGSGPAAWTAALYLARADLNPLVIGGKTPGGQLMNTTEVENYPGSVDGITGPELISVMEKQAKKFGTEVINDEVSEVKKTSKGFEINYGDGKKEESLAVIISTGSSYRHLGVPGEEEFSAKGVSYCAVCLPPDEAVIGNSSVKHISSIKEKQEVLTHDGSFQEVVGTTKRKFKGDLVKIKTRYFTEPVLLTKNHPVMSSTLARGSGANYWKDTSFSNPIWVKAGALKKGDLVHYPIIKKTQDIKNLLLSDLVNVRVDNKGLAHNLSETHTSKSIPNKIPLTKSFMRLVGYYLSEGSIFKHSFALYFSKKEKEYIKDASNLIRNIFGLEPRLIIKDNVCKVVAYSYLLCNFFESLFSKKSFAKKLPHWMLHLPLAKQREIIKGFYRGDGCMREKDYVLVSNSRQLVYQFRDILLRFGILPSITRRNKDQLNKKDHFIDGRKISFRHDKYHMVVKNGDSIRLMDQVLGEKHNILTKRIRSNSFAWIRNNYVLLPVTSVESESYGGYVHNIAVKKNNTYVAKNFIVHNCDAPFFKDKKTLVVGGGDSAMEEALALEKFAKEVYISHRRDEFRATKIMQDRVLKSKKIKPLWNTELKEITGDTTVKGVTLINNKTNKEQKMAMEGVFIAIGAVPNTNFLKGLIKLDDKGYIVTDRNRHTNVAGIFAAGDVQDYLYRQAITSAGSGCEAALEAQRYVEELNAEQ